jgi:hypothetical protein
LLKLPAATHVTRFRGKGFRTREAGLRTFINVDEWLIAINALKPVLKNDFLSMKDPPLFSKFLNITII